MQSHPMVLGFVCLICATWLTACIRSANPGTLEEVVRLPVQVDRDDGRGGLVVTEGGTYVGIRRQSGQIQVLDLHSQRVISIDERAHWPRFSLTCCGQWLLISEHPRAELEIWSVEEGKAVRSITLPSSASSIDLLAGGKRVVLRLHRETWIVDVTGLLEPDPPREAADAAALLRSWFAPASVEAAPVASSDLSSEFVGSIIDVVQTRRQQPKVESERIVIEHPIGGPPSGFGWAQGGLIEIHGDRQGIVRILTTEGHELGRVELPEPLTPKFRNATPVMSSDGGHLVVLWSRGMKNFARNRVLWEHRVLVYNIASGELVRDERVADGIEHVALSPDGRYLAGTEPKSGEIRVWEVPRDSAFAVED